MDNDKIAIIILSFIILIYVLDLLNRSIDARYTILPQEIHNLGAYFLHGLSSFWNELTGVDKDVNPRPYEDQPIDKIPQPEEYVFNPPELNIE